MDQLHIHYYKNAFEIELNQIKDKFEEILKYAEADSIKLSELNRNMKAVQWLNKTYGNNIQLYSVDS
jgi:hypothetical protein